MSVLLYPQIAGMCKTPLPFVDIIMLGPVIGVVNIMLGIPVSEWYLLFGITVRYELYNINSSLIVSRFTIFLTSSLFVKLLFNKCVTIWR